MNPDTNALEYEVGSFLDNTVFQKQMTLWALVQVSQIAKDNIRKAYEKGYADGLKDQ